MNTQSINGKTTLSIQFSLLQFIFISISTSLCSQTNIHNHSQLFLFLSSFSPIIFPFSPFSLFFLSNLLHSDSYLFISACSIRCSMLMLCRKFCNLVSCHCRCRRFVHIHTHTFIVHTDISDMKIYRFAQQIFIRFGFFLHSPIPHRKNYL